MPLLAFGLLTLGYAPLAGQLSLLSLLYWSIVAPVGFLLVGWWYRRRPAGVDAGPGDAPYTRTGWILLAAFALVLPLTAVQLPVIGIALLLLAVRQRNAFLGAFAVLFAVIGVLGTFTATLENLLYRAAYGLGWFEPQSGYFDGAPTIITGMTGLLLLAGGLTALRRERRLAA